MTGARVELRVVKVRSIFAPRWWRHPVRWWRMRPLRRLRRRWARDERRLDPVVREAAQRIEADVTRAFLGLG